MSKGKQGNIILLVILVILILLLFLLPKHVTAKNNALAIFLQVIFILSFSILVYFLFLWIRELNCVCFIKDKNIFNVAKKFEVNKLWICIMALSGIFSVLLLAYINVVFDTSILIGVLLISVYLIFLYPNKIEISTTLENNDINIGCGAAQTYFHGYLKVLMSQKQQTWERRLEKYEDEQKVQIFSKLIILLPKSCKTFDLLTNVKCVPNIFWAGELSQLETEICGNKRFYKNTVYVINEGIRFVAEYAPPINTFYQMSYIGTKYHLNTEMRREQYILFRQTLQDLISNDMDCINNCLLLSYNDDENFSLAECILLSINDDEMQKARSAG